MHSEILNQPQKNLLPLINKFSNDFGLVGGTAIALHIGHRRSIDFDLFTSKKSINHEKIKETIRKSLLIERVFEETSSELTLLIGGVKA